MILSLLRSPRMAWISLCSSSAGPCIVSPADKEAVLQILENACMECFMASASYLNRAASDLSVIVYVGMRLPPQLPEPYQFGGWVTYGV